MTFIYVQKGVEEKYQYNRVWWLRKSTIWWYMLRSHIILIRTDIPYEASLNTTMGMMKELKNKNKNVTTL